MKKLRVIGSIRVSKDEMAQDGVSLDAQRARLEAYAQTYDLEIVDIVEDHKSGKTLDREGLRQALTQLRIGEADGLLVARLDRLTRSVRDLGYLLENYFEKEYTLCSVTDHIDTRTAGGRFMLNVLMSVSQWEVETIGERTRDALVQVKAEGGVIGRERFGQRRTSEVDANGRLVVEECPEERATLEMVGRFAQRDGLGARAIAARLTDLGVKTKRGGRWHATQVQRMISRGRVSQ